MKLVNFASANKQQIHNLFIFSVISGIVTIILFIVFKKNSIKSFDETFDGAQSDLPGPTFMPPINIPSFNLPYPVISEPRTVSVSSLPIASQPVTQQAVPSTSLNSIQSSLTNSDTKPSANSFSPILAPNLPPRLPETAPAALSSISLLSDKTKPATNIQQLTVLPAAPIIAPVIQSKETIIKPVILSKSSIPDSSCLPKDKSSFITNRCGSRKCIKKDKSSFTNTHNNKCHLTEKSKYDQNNEDRLQMELKLLDMRRREISSKLHLNLDSGYKVGCNTDADCNKLNYSGARNVCRVDHSCSCVDGGGPFCLEPAHYRDPNEMTSQERERFKKQNDLSNFTKLDYIRWLLLYVKTPYLLFKDHLINLQKISRGDEITVADIPLTRESPPKSASEYLNLLDNNARIQFVNSETNGPYLASNFSDYEQFIPPADLVNYRVINDDMVSKQASKNSIQALTPVMSRNKST